MSDIQKFYRLKEKVLDKYKETYPYFKGDWQSFSSADIRNLIEQIEIQTKNNVSEKWIYTHLKPKENQKLPRKDMLDILSGFVGFSGWDEFIFEPEIIPKKKIPWLWVLVGLMPIIAVGLFFLMKKKDEYETIPTKKEKVKPSNETDKIRLIEKYTYDSVKEKEIEVFTLENQEKQPLKVENSKVERSKKEKDTLIIESPFYEEDTVVVLANETKIEVTPDEYVFQLKTYLNSDLKDWKARKQQMNKMFAENLETIIMLPNGLGAIALNKEESMNKLAFPTKSLTQIEIGEVLYNDEKKIEKMILIQR